MSQATQADTPGVTDTGLTDWQTGVVAGVIGGIGMGIIVSLQNPMVIKGAIAGLLTLQGNGIAGWIIHLSDAAIFGVIFAALMAIPMLQRYNTSVGASAGFGMVYGFLLWLLAAGIVFPIWLGVVGFPMPPANVVPNWRLPGTLIPHLVYGLLLGVLYPVFRGRPSAE